MKKIKSTETIYYSYVIQACHGGPRCPSAIIGYGIAQLNPNENTALEDRFQQIARSIFQVKHHYSQHHVHWTQELNTEALEKLGLQIISRNGAAQRPPRRFRKIFRREFPQGTIWTPYKTPPNFQNYELARIGLQKIIQL